MINVPHRTAVTTPGSEGSATDIAVPVAPAPTTSTYIPVVCRLCGTRLYGLPAQVGMAIRCPDCHVENVVPPPRRTKTARALVPADDDEYVLHEGVDQPPPRRTVDIPVTCRLCGTRMYASEFQIGSTVVCPDCKTANQVVAAPAAKHPKRELVEIGPAYQVESPPEVTQPRDEAKQVLLAASQQLRERAQQLPKPPRHPLFSGIIAFPFYPEVLIRGLAFTLGALVVWTLVESVETATPFMIPIICATAALAGLAVLTLGSVYLLTILGETSNGANRVDFVFEFSPIDWLLQSFFLVNSFTIAFLPGLIAGWLLGTPDRWGWYIAPGLFILFPVLLLSMLESNSCAAPYSRAVWSSLRTSTGPWCIVYGETGLLVAVVASLFWSAPFDVSFAARVAFVFVFVCACVIYFRLLGRLVWVCARVPSRRPNRIQSEPDVVDPSASSMGVAPGGGVPPPDRT